MATEPRRVALITGASRGIGAATAIEFARRGYDLAITAPPDESLDQVSRDIEQAGACVLCVHGDFIDLNFAQSLVSQTINKFGRIDVLVNNAAWREPLTLRDINSARKRTSKLLRAVAR